MKIEILKTNSNLLNSVRRTLHIPECDSIHDSKIEEMSDISVFSSFCDCHGIFDLGPHLWDVYHSLKNSTQNDKISIKMLNENDGLNIIENLSLRNNFISEEDKKVSANKFEEYLAKMDHKDVFSEYLTHRGIH